MPGGKAVGGFVDLFEGEGVVLEDGEVELAGAGQVGHVLRFARGQAETAQAAMGESPRVAILVGSSRQVAGSAPVGLEPVGST